MILIKNYRILLKPLLRLFAFKRLMIIINEIYKLNYFLYFELFKKIYLKILKKYKSLIIRQFLLFEEVIIHEILAINSIFF